MVHKATFLVAFDSVTGCRESSLIIELCTRAACQAVKYVTRALVLSLHVTIFQFTLQTGRAGRVTYSRIWKSDNYPATGRGGPRDSG